MEDVRVVVDLPPGLVPFPHCREAEVEAEGEAEGETQTTKPSKQASTQKQRCIRQWRATNTECTSAMALALAGRMVP